MPSIELVHFLHDLDLLLLVAADRILRLGLLQELPKLLLEEYVASRRLACLLE